MIDLWYKNSIIYSLDVETFMDSDGDGVGDFAGLTGQLDYLAGLGVTCLWLLPFYPTTNRDNGYDVTDYYAVERRFGTLGHFVEFARQARERGMRIIIDLVVNHTSDQHPWFHAARADRHSRYRDYYVWSEEEPAHRHQGMVFPGVQESIWTWDDQAGAWYLHRFFKYQPDLNTANPAVREEICRIMGFWLELGVSGFRLDAAPFLIEDLGVEDRDARDPHQYLRELRDFLSWRRGDAILLAEANVPPKQFPEYFGDGNRMHMLFNFIANQHLFLALAREQAAPLAHAVEVTGGIPEFCQWAQFVRNHDELDLGRLSDDERAEVFARFAPEETMRLYGRGIRRRLPPMLDGDRRRIELAYSLMFSLPGTPVVRYGEEIGMGDDLSLDQRDAVRTPMQWSAETNAGFSDAPPDRLVHPVIADGPFGYRTVNVRAQRREQGSFLQWMQRLIRTRREAPEIGWGDHRRIETGLPAVFAHGAAWRGGRVIVLHNLGGQPAEVALPSDAVGDGHLADLLSDQPYERPADRCGPLRLAGYGYRWLRVERHPS